MTFEDDFYRAVLFGTTNEETVLRFNLALERGRNNIHNAVRQKAANTPGWKEHYKSFHTEWQGDKIYVDYPAAIEDEIEMMEYGIPGTVEATPVLRSAIIESARLAAKNISESINGK